MREDKTFMEGLKKEEAKVEALDKEADDIVTARTGQPVFIENY